MWKFNNSSWEQDADACAFTIRSFNDRECVEAPAASLVSLLNAKTHPASNTTCAASEFPSEFSHCPSCGVALISTKTDSKPWIPPYGPADGLRVLEDDAASYASISSGGETFALPAKSGFFSFAVLRMGAKKRLLIAIDQRIGQVWIYSSHVDKWRSVGGLIGDSVLPSWSWSLASEIAEDGIAVPTTNGPAWVTIDWQNNRIVIQAAGGESVGGAACVGKVLFAPALKSGRFVMFKRGVDDLQWTECEGLSDPLAVATHLSGVPGQSAYFGTPVVVEGRPIAYWPCRGGYVKVTCADDGESASWELKVWGASGVVKALIELGVPYQKKAGARSGLWQLCERSDANLRDGVEYIIVKFDGEASDHEALDRGQFLTTGKACFNWLHDCWTDVHTRYPNSQEQHELRYPLLQFGDKGLVLLAKVIPWADKEDMGLFTELPSRESTYVRFVLAGAGIPEVGLLIDGIEGVSGSKGAAHRVLVSQVSQLAAFIFDRHLHIYFPEENESYKWPLEISSS